MKKFKAMTGYEMALAAEGSVSGCKVVLRDDVALSGKRRCFFGKKQLTMLLLAGMLLKVFHAIEIPSFAKTNSNVEMYDGYNEGFAGEDSLPGYREYERSFEAVYPKQEIRVGVEDCIGYEKNLDAEDLCNGAARQVNEIGQAAGLIVYANLNGMPGDSIYTGEGSLAEFGVCVEEEGFYDISLVYLPSAKSDAAPVRSILIDGEVPYRELARVCYDRVWAQEGGNVLTRQTQWITGAVYDRERHIVEPLSVYLSKGEHTVSLQAVQGPMLLHQIIFSQKQQIQEYKQVKGFWDAVGIRAARGKTVRIEAEGAVRASARMEYTEREESRMSVIPLRLPVHEKEAECSTIGGTSWQKAGSWFEWEFEVQEAGYYHISLYERQNYARDGAYRKIMLDGAVPFQEMERYGFAYRWGWKEEALSDDTGKPYVFYLKEGKHTLRMEAVPGESNPEDRMEAVPGESNPEAHMEAVPGETDPEAHMTGCVNPLTIDWIRMIPAGQ